MTERQILYKAVSNAAWGYFFLSLDIYFGSINILPSFVGYLLDRKSTRLNSSH